jgi:hypothetical protein
VAGWRSHTPRPPACASPPRAGLPARACLLLSTRRRRQAHTRRFVPVLALLFTRPHACAAAQRLMLPQTGPLQPLGCQAASAPGPTHGWVEMGRARRCARLGALFLCAASKLACDTSEHVLARQTHAVDAVTQCVTLVTGWVGGFVCQSPVAHGARRQLLACPCSRRQEVGWPRPRGNHCQLGEQIGHAHLNTTLTRRNAPRLARCQLGANR